MRQNKVEICGLNTSNIKVIPEKEKIKLITKAREGDTDAKDKLVKGNLRLVLSVVQKFSNRGEPLDDLFQIGCIGLIKAINNFNISQNTRFSTYAVPMIIGEIRRYLRDNTTVRVSRSMHDIAYKSIQVRERIFSEKNKEPTLEEIAKELEIPKETIAIALEAMTEPTSLNEPVFTSGDENLCLMDQVSGDNSESWTNEITIRQEIKNLSPREKMVLSLRFLGGKTQTQVAEKIGISQAQVSRIEKISMKKIMSN
ncbi:MAG: SigB/SigF/SigG family RNA polymerase sigma factor [Oscillospiraceae bacterium]|jgi:RNA polymerase sporulation-specific sigma factor|nr:SigB/SigF/SigG family RNA polymerase sigma factor [Oscillospiraceae bacterium]